MSLINDLVKNIVDQSVVKIDQIVANSLPKHLSELAQDIFDSSGKTHGRDWSSNKPSTIKKKGFNKRNVEEGQLEMTLIEEGFLLDSNYMDNLPIPSNGDPDGYLWANEYGRFDDIGRTQDDKKWIKEKLIKDIVNGYR